MVILWYPSVEAIAMLYSIYQSGVFPSSIQQMIRSSKNISGKCTTIKMNDLSHLFMFIYSLRCQLSHHILDMAKRSGCRFFLIDSLTHTHSLPLSSAGLNRELQSNGNSSKCSHCEFFIVLCPEHLPWCFRLWYKNVYMFLPPFDTPLTTYLTPHPYISHHITYIRTYVCQIEWQKVDVHIKTRLR